MLQKKMPFLAPQRSFCETWMLKVIYGKPVLLASWSTCIFESVISAYLINLSGEKREKETCNTKLFDYTVINWRPGELKWRLHLCI